MYYNKIVSTSPQMPNPNSSPFLVIATPPPPPHGASHLQSPPKNYRTAKQVVCKILIDKQQLLPPGKHSTE